MYFYLYKITNLINNKIYIGVHQTENLDDEYLGSGTMLNRAIKKHGVSNFKKEILQFFDNQQEMFNREKEIVTEEFISKKDNYNIKLGGNGGFDHIFKNPKRKEWLRQGYEKTMQIFSEKGITWKHLSDKGIKSLKENKKGVGYDPELSKIYNFKFNIQNQRRGNLPAAREKAKLTQKQTYAQIKHQQGSKNSQYGTCWIFNDDRNMKIKRDELQKYIDLGWKKGRKML